MNVLLLQNSATEGFGLYQDYLQAKHIDFDLVHAYRDRLPPAADYDAFIVGGTPISANDVDGHDWFRDLFAYLRAVVAQERPYLGICCGGQLLARLLGAAVRRNPKMEIGGYDLRLTPAGRTDPLLQGFDEPIPVFHWHGDSFDIPAGTKNLLMGDDCHNQVFRHGRQVALQFHLEVTVAEAMHWVEAYADELPRVGKNADQVVHECRIRAPEMRRLAGLLLDNFFALAV